jgi:hypothetical protein
LTLLSFVGYIPHIIFLISIWIKLYFNCCFCVPFDCSCYRSFSFKFIWPHIVVLTRKVFVKVSAKHLYLRFSIHSPPPQESTAPYISNIMAITIT